MKKRGFTLIELLVTIVILSLLGAIGIVSFTTFMGNGDERYYATLESNLLLAGNDYFLDHRSELPTENHVSEVSISTLVNEKYIEPLKKSNGEACNDGTVYVHKEKDKYRYTTCIRCDENYTSSGCAEEAINEIVVLAKKETSNTTYDVSQNYNNAPYSNENIKLTISMKNATTNISQFEIENTKNGNKITCNKTGNSTCETEAGRGITVSGTYKITAKLGNKEIATKYINVKIDKGTPSFTIEKGAIAPLTCTGTDTSREVTIKIIKSNVNEEYQSIEYKIYQKELNETTGEQDRTLVKSGTEANITKGTSAKEYLIKETLGSGRYELEVSVTNFAGEKLTNDTPEEFDVSYYANVVYADNDYTGVSNTHEVVYKQKYDYKSTLPTSKVKNNNEIDILWTKNNESINGNTKVTDTCTHTIVGTLAREVVQIEDFAKIYCADVTYNGEEQDLAPTHPANVTFKNRWQTNVTHPKLAASIDDSQYIWSDGTIADIEFECPMKPRPITVTASDQSKTYDATELTADDTCTASGNLTGHTVTCSGNTGGITNAGDVGKVVGNVTITANNVDVTNNYKVTKVNGTLTVNKATGYVDLSAESGSVTYGKTTTFTITGSHGGTLSCESSNTAKATCTRSNNTITVSGAGAGSTTLTVKSAATDNYTEGSKTYSITVEKASVTFPTCASKTWTGSSQELYPAHTSGDFTNTAITGIAADASPYKGTLTLTSPENTEWSDTGLSNARELSCTIKGVNAATYISTKTNVTTDDGVKRFSGATANNYITFYGSRVWRAIGVYTNGSVKNVKILYKTKSNRRYDDSSITWSGSDLEVYLNGTGATQFIGKMDATTKSMICPSCSWNVGKIKERSGAVRIADAYSDAATTKWSGSVGLLATYEYGYATDKNKSTTGTNSSCWDISMKAYGTGNTKCAKYNWIYNWLPKDSSKTPTYAEYALRLLGPAYGTGSTWVVMNEGYFSTGGVSLNSFVIWPAVYLKSNVLIVGGAGTASNPWRLALE